MGRTRLVAGAVLLDLAVSPLFAWDVFTESLRRDLAVSDTLLASVFSVGLVAFTAAVLVGGRVADSVAPRRLALLTAVGTVTGLLGSAAATSVDQMVLTFGVLVGGSTGLGYATAVRLAGTVPSRRGLVVGLVVSAYAAGAAVLAPVAAALLVAVGRSWTFVLLAVGLGAVLAAAAVLVPGVSPANPNTPRRQSGRAFRRPSGPVVALWLAFGFGCAPALAAFAQAGALVGTPSTVALAVPLLNIGNLVGRLVAGPLSDVVGRSASLHANSALLVLACLPLALGSHGPAALVALLLLGTQYGAWSALAPLATSSAVPDERFGTTYGLVFTGWGAAGLLAPVAAASLAATAGYGPVYRIFLVVAALSWACVTAYARLVHERHEPRG